MELSRYFSHLIHRKELRILALFLEVYIRAVVSGGAGGALAPLEFGISEQTTEREIRSMYY